MKLDDVLNCINIINENAPIGVASTASIAIVPGGSASKRNMIKRIKLSTKHDIPVISFKSYGKWSNK